MNKQEVLQALEDGHKVTLPEWIGYWFMENGHIKVFTRDCRVVTSPYLWYLENRTDWEIADGSRDFPGALYALEAGKRVTRKKWGDKVWIERFNPETYPNCNVWNGVSPWYGIKTKEDTLEAGWTPTTTDMMAKDWIIVDK